MREADRSGTREAAARAGTGDLAPALQTAGVDHLASRSRGTPGVVAAVTVREPLDAALDDVDEVVWWVRASSEAAATTYLFEAVPSPPQTDANGPDRLQLRGGDSPTVPWECLPDRQRAVVETALSAGFYEAPREATVAEVADRVDADPSTVAERLRRAERGLVSAVLSG